VETCFAVRRMKKNSALVQVEKLPELPQSILFSAGMFDHKSEEDLRKRGIFSIPSGYKSLRTPTRTVRYGSELILANTPKESGSTPTSFLSKKL